MGNLEEFSKYGSTGICIVIIIAVVYIIKLLIPVFTRFSDAIELNTKATNELVDFMHNLNGKLLTAVKSSVGKTGATGATGKKGEKGEKGNKGER